LPDADAMQIPEAYRYYVDNLLQQARLVLERGEPLVSRAFVGELAGRRVVTVPVDASSEEAMARSARLIRWQAELLSADFVFQMREAWQLPQKHRARHEEIVARYGSIAASPQAEDVVALSLETVHGHWLATPRIQPKPPSKKRRTLGAADFQYFPDIGGRLVGLLPGAGSTPSGSGAPRD
jgi:hypothetical protein